MSKFFVVVFIIVLLILSWLAHLNNETIQIAITDSIVYTPLKIELIIISSVWGGLMVFALFFINDTRRYLQSRRLQKSQKEHDKVNTLYSRAVHYLLINRIDEAVIQLNEALKVNRNHIPAMLQLADIHLKRKDYDKTEEILNAARTQDRDNPEILIRLIDLKEAMENNAEAIVIADELLRIEPDNAVALNKKRAAMERLNRWDDLIMFHKGMKMTDAVSNMAMTGYYYESGRYGLENNDLEKARRAFNSAILLDSQFVPAHLGMAEILISEGDIDAAVDYLERGYETTQSIIFLVRLEDLMISIGDPSRLIKIYNSAINRRPGDGALKIFLAKLYYRLEMLDDAFDLLERIDAPSFIQEIRQIRAGIHIKHSRFVDAVREYTKILNLKKAIIIPYQCTECSYRTTEWSGRCPDCGRWNTFTFERDMNQRE